jgi:hypothetical protein
MTTPPADSEHKLHNFVAALQDGRPWSSLAEPERTLLLVYEFEPGGQQWRNQPVLD